jgi:hypothetical protein
LSLYAGVWSPYDKFFFQMVPPLGLETRRSFYESVIATDRRGDGEVAGTGEDVANAEVCCEKFFGFVFSPHDHWFENKVVAEAPIPFRSDGRQIQVPGCIFVIDEVYMNISSVDAKPVARSV